MSGKESETCRKIVLNRHPLSFADSRAVRKDEYSRTWCETYLQGRSGAGPCRSTLVRPNKHSSQTGHFDSSAFDLA